MRCNKCSAEIEEKFKLCPYCGERILSFEDRVLNKLLELEERINLLENQKSETKLVTKSMPARIIVRRKLDMEDFYRKACNIIRNSDKPLCITTIAKQVLNRTVGGKETDDYRKYIESKRQYGFSIRKIGKRTLYMPNNIVEKRIESEKNSKRGSFITSRANVLMRTENLTRSQAMSRACMEWESHSMLGTVTPGFDYSKILGRNGEKVRELLKTNLCEKKFIQYTDCSDMWTLQEWSFAFIPNLLKHSDEVLKDLNLTGKLVSTGLGRVELKNGGLNEVC